MSSQVLAAKNSLCIFLRLVPTLPLVKGSCPPSRDAQEFILFFMTDNWPMWAYNSSAHLPLGGTTFLAPSVLQRSPWDQAEDHLFVNPHLCGVPSFALSLSPTPRRFLLSPYPFTGRWTFRLSACLGRCGQCCCEDRDAGVFLTDSCVCARARERGCWPTGSSVSRFAARPLCVPRGCTSVLAVRLLL